MGKLDWLQSKWVRWPAKIIFGALQVWDWIVWGVLGVVAFVQGWYLHHQYDWPVVLIFVFAFLASAIFLVDKGKKFFGFQSGSTVKTASTPEPAVVPQEPLAPFITVFWGEARHQAPSGQDAYVTFHFWLSNGALRSFYIKGVRGHVRHTGAELGGNIDLKSGQEDIPRGAKYELIIRQWITPASSKRIGDMTRDDTRSEFSFDGVYITIASRDAGAESTEEKLQLPPLSNCGRKPWWIEWRQ
jgi:hypothetical protein